MTNIERVYQILILRLPAFLIRPIKIYATTQDMLQTVADEINTTLEDEIEYSNTHYIEKIIYLHLTVEES